MIFTFAWLALLAHSTFAAPSRASGCTISPTKSSPLIIASGSEEFLYPKPGEKSLTFSAGETVDFVCPGSKLKNVKGTPQFAQATCVSSQKFEILDKNTQFSKITCSGSTKATSRITDRTCADEAGVEGEIGFSVSDGRFLRTILVCFDLLNQTPLWSNYNITASIGSRISGSRPSFTQDEDFWNVGSSTVNQLYGRSKQRATINGLVGLSSTSTKYIKGDSSYFLSRGHLAAKADFVYPAQQVSTFRYINAAPQFQTFNGGNWNNIEMAVRDYADDNEEDLLVWTGIYGVTTLPHENTGEDVSLGLYVDSNGNLGLPVPELYWRIVYNSETKRGIALLGVNNPYQEDISKSIICDDISENISWLPSSIHKTTKGYSYACSIPDLKKAIESIPDLDVTGLLE